MQRCQQGQEERRATRFLRSAHGPSPSRVARARRREGQGLPVTARSRGRNCATRRGGATRIPCGWLSGEGRCCRERARRAAVRRGCGAGAGGSCQEPSLPSCRPGVPSPRPARASACTPCRGMGREGVRAPRVRAGCAAPVCAACALPAPLSGLPYPAPRGSVPRPIQPLFLGHPLRKRPPPPARAPAVAARSEGRRRHSKWLRPGPAVALGRSAMRGAHHAALASPRRR